jgi:hypothetical protein
MSENLLVRTGLLGASALAAALVAVGLRRYPVLLHGGAEVVVYLSMLAAGLALCVAAASSNPARHSAAWQAARRDGCRWGLPTVST